MPQSKKKRAGVGAKGSIFSRLIQPSPTIRLNYPSRDKNHQFSELIILGRVWRKVSLWDKEGWCLEVSHEDFDDFLFVKHRMVSIDEEGDEEGIFKKISQFEEGEAPRIINTYQDSEIVPQLEGNIKNLPWSHNWFRGFCVVSVYRDNGGGR